MIEIHLLEQLAEFKKAGTLSKAAKKLLISQPALSRSMQKLEDEMGVPLFERHKNKILLNENGMLTADYARQILKLESDMIEHVRSLERSKHTITIGTNAPGPILYYKSLLSQLFPEMTIVTELDDENSLLSSLKNETYQFIFLPHELSIPGLFCTHAASEHLYLSVIPAHPVSSFKEISFQDMDGESFLMYTHVGFWNDIVRKNMPNSRFLLQNEFDDFGEIINHTSLPCFTTDLTTRNVILDMADRVAIPFSDEDAFADYYFICKESNQKKFEAFISHFSN